MDRSRVFQTNKEYSLDLGSLNINTFNGRALYSYPVASIGSGNYAIDVLLVYNSFYDSMDFLNKKIGLGNGWKLNYEQYLFKYDNSFYLDDFSINDYVYIDEAWCIHRFIKYSETTVNDIKICEYYDDSGTGLKLTIRNDTDYEISDEANNKYIFDLEGRLIRIISGINSNMRKEISYDTMGIPVIAIGVPTVVEASVIVYDTINYLFKHISYIKDNQSKNKLIFSRSNYVDKIKDKDLNLEEKRDILGMIGELSDTDKKSLIEEVLTSVNYNFIVTPKEVDFVIDKLSMIIGDGINKCLHDI